MEVSRSVRESSAVRVIHADDAHETTRQHRPHPIDGTSGSEVSPSLRVAVRLPPFSQDKEAADLVSEGCRDTHGRFPAMAT